MTGGFDRAAAGVRALSPWDAQIYAAAFEAAEAGDFDSAAEQAARAADKSLVGHLELRKLMSPTYKASYEELAAWLERHGDLVGADKIYALARKRRPAGAPEPAAPASSPGARNWALLDSIEDPDADRSTNRGRAARELFYGGQVKAAYDAAVGSGERWIAGLAAFRLRNYPEAVRRFEMVARDQDESDWLRAGAAFWAARASIAAGQPELAPDFLRLAAAYPTTFYGLIAERQLGLDSTVDAAEAAAEASLHRAVFAEDEAADLAAFVASTPRARRAAALAQIGLIEEAAVELRAALAGCKSEDERRAWIALAVALDTPMAALQDGRGERFEAADYPTPILAPRGGFTLDPALVYAIVRQESRFNPSARSHAGATGLMQLMPSTAAWFSGDKRLKRSGALRDPATNLRVGQDYFEYLLKKDYVGQDLLRALAAYNGGSGPLIKTLEALGDDADSLMLIESLPYAETRNYVERVMAGYWIYRQMFGAETASLDALASGARTVEATLDRSTAPGPQRAAVVHVG
jgi:soluble lytic murein transglycosylase-like protein